MMITRRAPIQWSSRLWKRPANISRTSRRNPRQQLQRRTYASEGHESKKGASESLWAFTSLAVTLPSCYFLMMQHPSSWGMGPKPESHGHGGHDDHGDDAGHDKESDEGNGEDGEGAADGGEGKTGNDEDEGKSEGGDSSDGGEDDKGSDNDTNGQEDTPETSEDESGESSGGNEKGGDVEGVQFKGTTKEGGDTRYSIPDAKGGFKRRIDSDYGKKQGEGEAHGDEDQPLDNPAASKPTAGTHTQSDKQKGMFNADTKHSTDIGNDPEKSKKGEGAPETAKLKGTVNPSRPQV